MDPSHCFSQTNHVSLVEHEWVAWKFSKTPPSFWQHQSNQLAFMQWLEKKLNFDPNHTDLDRWYNVSVQTVIEHGGAGLLTMNGGSLYGVLKNLYPTHHWQPWRFVRTPKGIWEDVSVRRYVPDSTCFIIKLLLDFVKLISEYFEEMAKQMNLKSLDDWYSVSLEKALQLGAGTIINNYYNNSLITALQQLYPEHKWEPWKFSKLPKSLFWRTARKTRKSSSKSTTTDSTGKPRYETVIDCDIKA